MPARAAGMGRVLRGRLGGSTGTRPSPTTPSQSVLPQESVNRLHAQMQAFVSESQRAAELEEKRRYRFLAEKHLLLSNTFLQFFGRVSAPHAASCGLGVAAQGNVLPASLSCVEIYLPPIIYLSVYSFLRSPITTDARRTARPCGCHCFFLQDAYAGPSLLIHWQICSVIVHFIVSFKASVLLLCPGARPLSSRISCCISSEFCFLYLGTLLLGACSF